MKFKYYFLTFLGLFFLITVYSCRKETEVEYVKKFAGTYVGTFVYPKPTFDTATGTYGPGSDSIVRSEIIAFSGNTTRIRNFTVSVDSNGAFSYGGGSSRIIGNFTDSSLNYSLFTDFANTGNFEGRKKF